MSEAASITSKADLLAIARAIEEQALEQYGELAEAFAMSCNADAAQAFRELADDRSPRVAEFPPLAGAVPVMLPWGDMDPEISDPEAVHYLMWPWHAFDLALRHETLTRVFFETVARGLPAGESKDAAEILAERARKMEAAMQAKRDQSEIPPDDWDDDPDPPNWEASE